MADWSDVHDELAGLIERLAELQALHPFPPPRIYWFEPDNTPCILPRAEDYRIDPRLRPVTMGKDGEA